ncbi:exonuclease mut-7 homolog [Tribolium castaneum]|nr:PREDICTED: exonuclease mut-7 homolog [Tribolium castaneum]|eukprot:XP_008191355.1 PREDICTED: exonuclease mut-7 homolog [Tribolium castaneum]
MLIGTVCTYRYLIAYLQISLPEHFVTFDVDSARMNAYRGRGRGRGYFRGAKTNPPPSMRSPRNPPLNTNQSISHDNNCCNGISIVLELDLDSTSFLNELKSMWNLLKKSPPVVNKLHQYFHLCENPYEHTIRLMYNCQEFNSAKSKSLPFFIIEEFKIWLSVHRNKVVHLLTPKLKIDVFKIISKQNAQNLTKLVVDVYEMAQDGEIFLDIIKCMIERKRYKEACQSAVLFNLQDKFSVEDFLLPLILQDKLYGIDDFLTVSPRHQVELVTLLDSTLGRTSVRDALASYVFNLDVPDIKWDKLHAKPLKKLITRLVKMFKLPTNITPNLNKRRNEGALQFLLHKRFVENSFGDESWKEMVQEAIGEDEELQRELVAQVSTYGAVAEALWWAHFYNVDKQHWPYNVRMLEENPDEERLHQRNILPEEESWGYDEVQNTEPVEYHKFPLPFSSIHLIDSEESFERFLDGGLQDVEVVGIDCEWKPNFGSQKNELALMQIASRKNVFILDIISIGTKVPHLWQELGKFLFNNCDILKLGFGFTSDILMIKHSLPELNFTPKQVGFLDLLSLWKLLEKYPKVVLPYEVQGSGPSLGTLVNQCLGRPLDKSDQFSNWEKRPLRNSQLVYAALDAYCLIEVYDVIKGCCEKAEFPFDETCYNLMTNEKAPKKKAKKPVQKKPKPLQADEEIAQPPSPHSSQVPAASIKVVCDTMLQGLGKNLRRCGIDTAILENYMDHMECVRYAQDEQRYILTKGNVFNKLYGYVPLGHCLRVNSDNVDEQLKEFVDYYKVNVTVNDVFSVCQSCNGRSFIKVSRSTMLALTQSQNSLQYVPPDYDNDIDEATGFSSDDDFDFEPGPPVQTTRKWDLYSDEKLDVGLCQTRLGAKIQVATIPDGVLEKTELFYVCEHCGKIFWDGSHLERVLTGRLQGIVQ